MVTGGDGDRFAIGAGRERPPYEPKRITCAGCGASQGLKDERSRMAVCEYCGRHLEISGDELKVLGEGPGRDWQFPIELGADFRLKGQRFEVIARLALIEDGDVSELTRQYLLYNPRRGTQWLSEYRGHYDLSESTHVMPEGDPLTAKRGDVFKTFDGREWVVEGTGEYELTYVDGALPWLAQVGDRNVYAEAAEKTGSGATFEVESLGDEVEYAIGRKIPLAAVKSALGRQDLPAPAEPLENVVEKRRWFHRVMAIAGVVLLVNLAGAWFCMQQGKTVLRQHFSAAELSSEVMSGPFPIASSGNVVKVVARAGLDNAWMALDVALVEGEDRVVHLFDQDIEYYHGVEGGESWSEGSRKKTTYFLAPSSGAHHLLLHAVSARGNASTAETCEHGLEVQVIDGAARPHAFVGMAVLSGVIFVLLIVLYSSWKSQGEDEED